MATKEESYWQTPNEFSAAVRNIKNKGNVPHSNVNAAANAAALHAELVGNSPPPSRSRTPIANYKIRTQKLKAEIMAAITARNALINLANATDRKLKISVKSPYLTNTAVIRRQLATNAIAKVERLMKEKNALFASKLAAATKKARNIRESNLREFIRLMREDPRYSNELNGGTLRIGKANSEPRGVRGKASDACTRNKSRKSSRK